MNNRLFLNGVNRYINTSSLEKNVKNSVRPSGYKLGASYGLTAGSETIAQLKTFHKKYPFLEKLANFLKNKM